MNALSTELFILTMSRIFFSFYMRLPVPHMMHCAKMLGGGLEGHRVDLWLSDLHAGSEALQCE